MIDGNAATATLAGRSGSNMVGMLAFNPPKVGLHCKIPAGQCH